MERKTRLSHLVSTKQNGTLYIFWYIYIMCVEKSYILKK